MFKMGMNPFLCNVEKLQKIQELKGKNSGLNLYNRHLDFVMLMTQGGNRLKRYCHSMVSGPNGVLYSHLVSGLNQKQIDKKGVYEWRFNTTWRKFAKDAEAFMKEQDRKETKWNRKVNRLQAALHAALDDDNEAILLDDQDGFESPPLCAIIGNNKKNAVLLIIYKTNGYWKALLKHHLAGEKAFVPFMASFILRKLKIENVKIIPGLEGNVDDNHSDTVKEAYVNVAKIFDGGDEFDTWKEFNSPELTFNIGGNN